VPPRPVCYRARRRWPDFVRSVAIAKRVPRPLVLLLAAFAVMATAYNAAVPIFEAPDEHLHYLVADHIARTGSLPVQTLDPDARGPWEQEGSQPPLYYLLAAPLVRATGGWLDPADLRINDRNTMGSPALVGNDNRFVHDPAAEGWPWRGYALGAHAVRALSTLLAAVAVAALYGLARHAFDGPERDPLALAVAALVAFNPQWLALSASVTNDVLVVALAALVLWLLARILDGECTWPTLIALAITVGLAPLAKLSGLALLAFAAATLAWDGWRNRDLRYAPQRIALLGASAAVLSGWWYARNVALYGSLTGIEHMLVEGVGRDLNPERFLRGLPAEIGGLWQSSWGIFGWFTVPLPEWAFAVIALASLVGLAGAGAALVRRAPWLRVGRVAWLCAWWLILFASLMRWLLLVKGAHGRLLFPAIAAPAVLLVAGWRFWAGMPSGRLNGRRAAHDVAREQPGGIPAGAATTRARAVPGTAGPARAVALATAAATAALAAFALLAVLRPAFAPPALIAESDISAGATRVDAVFADRLRLVAYEIPRRAVAERAMPVTLYWQVTAPITRDVFVGLRVDQAHGLIGASSAWDDSGAPAARIDVVGEAALAYAGAGALPFDLVAPGDDVIVDRRWLVLPQLATSMPLRPDEGPIDAAMARARPVDGLPLRASLSIHVWEPKASASWTVTEARDATFVGRNGVAATFALDPEERPELGIGPEIARFADGLVLAWPEGSVDTTIGAAEGASNAPSGAASPPARRTGSEGDVPTAPPAHPSASARPVSIMAPSLRASDAVSPSLAIVWRVQRDPNEAVQLLVHLLDEEGNMVAQFDGPPVVYGDYPTDFWRAGDVLPGRVAFDVPPSAPPGDRFRLVVGLYRLDEGFSRLAASAPDGARLPDDLVTLAEVTVTGEADR